MQRHHAAALCTCPLLLFFQQELFRTNGFDSKSVFDQADLVSQPVPFVYSSDSQARKRDAFRTETNAAAEGTIPNVAPAAIGRLVLFLSPASRAGVLFPEMCIAYRAIHPTGCQHDHRYFHFPSRSSAILFPPDDAKQSSALPGLLCAGHRDRFRDASRSGRRYPSNRFPACIHASDQWWQARWHTVRCA
jgi:hypothetical protein